MNLKNYTSSTPANTTISYIETYLAECGVTGISKEFERGQPVALSFHVNIPGENGTPSKMFTIRLPAKVSEVHEWLWRDYMCTRSRPQKDKEDFREQATRTAWKIQQDWVQIQMSLIKLKQADFLQVFLAYIWDGEKTYYDTLRGGKFKALPEKAGT